MASNDYDIVNLALVRLGATRITSMTDGTKNASEANAIYELIRDEILRDHEWNFCTRYQWLKGVVENVLTVTAITKANPGKVTYTGTDPDDGDLYEADSIVGMTEITDGTEVVITNVSTGGNTFELYDTNGDKINTSAYVAAGTGGTFTQVLPQTENWGYIFTLPSRCLRVLEINDDTDEDFEIVEDRYLLCNSDECRCRFIDQVTTVSEYDATFVNLFAWRLAMELCIPITGDTQKATYASQMYNYWNAKSKATDASEGRTKSPSDNRYIDARR